MTTDNFCFYLQNRLIQTSQTGGQWYSDTSPFSIPWHFNFFGQNSHFLQKVEVITPVELADKFFGDVRGQSYKTF
jgi:hypothetical protein